MTEDTPAVRRELARRLAREHDVRTLRTRAGLEPRPSRVEEEQLTDDARRQERERRNAAVARLLGHLAYAERSLAAARDELTGVDRASRRDLDRIRQAIDRMRERHR